MKDAQPAMQSYTAIIEAASDGTFGVFFPDVPGCTSAGDTIEEATTNAAEALEFHLENMDDWHAPSDPASIVAEHGLNETVDTDAVAKLVDKAMAANPDKVEQYRGGQKGLFGYFMGQVMGQAGAAADPQTVQKLLRARLDG